MKLKSWNAATTRMSRPRRTCRIANQRNIRKDAVSVKLKSKVAIAVLASGIMAATGTLTTPVYALPTPAPSPVKTPTAKAKPITSATPKAAPAETTAPPKTTKPKPGSPTGKPTRLDGPSAMSIGNLQNGATGLFLDSNYEGHVYTLSRQYNRHQKWDWGLQSTFQNQASRRCLDSNYDGSVYALACNGGNYQKWYVYTDYTMRNAQTGRCLDSNYNGHVYTLPCNGGSYQKWFWVSAS